MKQRLATSSDNHVNADPQLTFDLQGEEYANNILAARVNLPESQPVLRSWISQSKAGDRRLSA